MGSTFKSVVVLTDAEIKTLPTVFPLIVSPINPGKTMIPLSGTIELNPWHADYTNIDMGSLLVGDWVISSVFPTFSGLSVSFETNANSILAPGAATITEYDYSANLGPNFMPLPSTSLRGEPFGLVCTSGSGNLTGGDVRNRLTITTFFYIA